MCLRLHSMESAYILLYNGTLNHLNNFSCFWNIGENAAYYECYFFF